MRTMTPNPSCLTCTRVLRLCFVLMLAAVVSHPMQPLGAMPCEQRAYLINKGTEQFTSQWVLMRGDPIILTTRQKSEECISVLSPRGESLSLRVKDRATRIEVCRTGEILSVNGTLNGKSINRRYHLDGAPWCQVMSYSLIDFVLGDKMELAFWMLHPETYVPYKMRAVKEGIETITLHGVRIEALRVSLRIKGVLAPFWHADVWYRTGDGVLIRYKSLNGPPGSPETSAEYLGPDAAVPR